MTSPSSDPATGAATMASSTVTIERVMGMRPSSYGRRALSGRGAVAVIGPLFVLGIASRTLAGLAKVAEAEHTR